ncbi:MAG TPA: glycosyltransferase family 1 protein [Actinobacteria bacterium]|nr:glycosyltransferase family 1 protein [Actinomycetota bacterium]
MSLAVAILGPTVRQDRSASVGGVAVHTAALAGALRAAGARVAVLSDSEYAGESGPGTYGVRGASAAWLTRTAAAHPLTAADVLWRSATSAERRRLGLPLRRTFSRALLIRRALDAERPDVVHAQQADFRPLYLRLAGATTPVVTVVHGLGGLETGEHPAMRVLLPEHLAAAAAVTAPSQALLDEARSLQPRIRRARVIPNAVDHGLFRPSDVAEARAAVGLGHHAGPVLLYAGRITEHKGAGDLLEAFETIRRERPGAMLVMVGPWGLDARLPGPDSGVTVVDATPPERMPLWFSAATLTVVPSRYEGFGLVALESLACGTPVLATDAGGLPEVVDPRAGALAPPRSPEALARKALELLADPRRLERMSAAGLEVAARYSWSAVAAACLALYAEVAGPHDGEPAA